VAQDEAYYYDWARALAWGYFDHPPGVAVLGLGAPLLPGSALAARLGTLLASTLTLLALWRLYYACGLRWQPLLALSLLLAAATFPGLVSGVLTTPDTVLALFWVIALHEALAALPRNGRVQRWRWLSAGAATGLGLLGKYTMVMIGPVFLIALLTLDRRALRTPWPYLGGLVALLVLLPNLIWNAQHDWLTLRFQFGHGFLTDTGTLSLPADALLGAETPQAGEHAGADALDTSERLSGVGSFIGVQLLFWGLPLLVALAAPFTGRRWWRSFAELGDLLFQVQIQRAFLRDQPGLLLIGSWLLEMADAPPWHLGIHLMPDLLHRDAHHLIYGWVFFGVIIMIMFLVGSIWRDPPASLPLPQTIASVLRETNGYPALAAHLDTLDPAHLFADRYQTVAMLNFYGAGVPVSQWPGLTRPSEYGLGKIQPIPPLVALRKTGFTLVVWKYAQPDIPGFRRVHAETLFDCRGLPLHRVPGIAWPEASPCGDDWLHVWRVLRYEAEPAPEARTGARDATGQPDAAAVARWTGLPNDGSTHHHRPGPHRLPLLDVRAQRRGPAREAPAAGPRPARLSGRSAQGARARAGPGRGRRRDAQPRHRGSGQPPHLRLRARHRALSASAPPGGAAVRQGPGQPHGARGPSPGRRRHAALSADRVGELGEPRAARRAARCGSARAETRRWRGLRGRRCGRRRGPRPRCCSIRRETRHRCAGGRTRSAVRRATSGAGAPVVPRVRGAAGAGDGRARPT